MSSEIATIIGLTPGASRIRLIGAVGRFCDEMRSIRAEIREIEIWEADNQDHVLKNGPDTLEWAAASTSAYVGLSPALPSP